MTHAAARKSVDTPDEVKLNRLLSDLRFDWIELGASAIKIIDLRQH